MIAGTAAPLRQVHHRLRRAFATRRRHPASGRGKRGGARIIYDYLDDTMPLYALLAHAKRDQGDMTPEEKRAVSVLAAAIKATRKEKR